MALSVLYNFSGKPASGEKPHGNLTQIGEWLYGTTYQGGSKDYGTIFRIKIDGSGFEILHNFTGPLNDGAGPLGSLLHSEGVLYGTTQYGGNAGWGHGWLGGTIFKINTDGTGYAVLHKFQGGASYGAQPRDSLYLGDDGNLYGFTPDCGYVGMYFWSNGTIFKIAKNGTGYTVLHLYSGNYVGSTPPSGGFGDLSGLYGTPIVQGSILYGISEGDGQGFTASPSNDDPYGTFFSMKTDGSDFTILKRWITSFKPKGSLAYRSGYFYGMSLYNDSGPGTFFKIDQGGNHFEILHSFDELETPNGSPTFARASVLIGTGQYGGGLNKGAIFSISGTILKDCFYGLTNFNAFRIDIDGSDFTVLGDMSSYIPGDTLTAYAQPLAGERRADGYVKQTVLAGQSVRIFFDGINEHVSDLVPGQLQFLDQYGKSTPTARGSGLGGISQIVGVASDDGKLVFHPYPIIKLWEG